MENYLPRERPNSWQCKILSHISEVTRWADMQSPHRCGIILDSINSWTDCKIPFTDVNWAWYYFMLDLLKFLEKDDYLFRLWFSMKIKESKDDDSVKVGLADEIKDMMYEILKDQWCDENEIDETFYNYAD